jgi:Arc/MetJ family transcription regulator
MRTNIDIDERLMAEAMLRSGARTKKAAVEAGLRLLLKPTPKAQSVASEVRSSGKAISPNPARALPDTFL